MTEEVENFTNLLPKALKISPSDKMSHNLVTLFKNNLLSVQKTFELREIKIKGKTRGDFFLRKIYG